jgi:hypothetical protein
VRRKEDAGEAGRAEGRKREAGILSELLRETGEEYKEGGNTETGTNQEGGHMQQIWSH